MLGFPVGYCSSVALQQHLCTVGPQHPPTVLERMNTIPKTQVLHCMIAVYQVCHAIHY